MKPRIAVLVSGNGSNLQSLIDAKLEGEIALVISNRKCAYALTRASDAGIPNIYFPLLPYKQQQKSRIDYDIDLANIIKQHNIQLIVLAGWMHILSKEFIDHFPFILNLHPALPGAFDGANAIERAFEAFQRNEITETGVMVHKVIPQVDRGEVVCMERIPIYKSDCLNDLESRVHGVEHDIIVKAVQFILNQIK